MPISRQEARKRAEENWSQWRLILARMITYGDLDLMDQDDILEANAALDLHLEQQQAQTPKPKGTAPRRGRR